MNYSELRKKGNKLYHLAHYSRKYRVRKKNIRRLRKFEEKYHIPTGPIPESVKNAGRWNDGTSAGEFRTTFGFSSSVLYGMGARVSGII